MKHSSKRNPCPICSRDIDDKCRWSDDFILCYDGDSFGPPKNLQIGNKIKIKNQEYALCSKISGFAGSSFCFAITDDFSYRFLKYEDKRTHRMQCLKITKEFLERKKSIDFAIKFVKLNENLHMLTLAELKDCKLIAQKGKSQIEGLLKYGSANKRYIVEYFTHVNALFEGEATLTSTLEGISNFEKECLGIQK